MSASFQSLRSKFPWVREIILSYNSFCEARENDHTNSIRFLDNLVAETIRLINEKTIEEELMDRNVEDSISFLEDLINSVNETHASSAKVIPHFDEKMLPLFEKYTEVLVHCASSTDTQVESMNRLSKFFIGLSTHPALDISSTQRAEAILIKLASKILSEVESEESNVIYSCEETGKESSVVEDRNQQQLSPNSSTVKHRGNDNKKEDEKKNEQTDANGGKEVITNVMDGELSIIPESPLKSPQATCVGSATIRGILPLSSGFLFPLTPPQAESSVIEFTSDSVEETNLPNFLDSVSTLAPCNLTELQKNLRQRFHTPHVVTPTEKKIHSTVLRTIRSHRRRTLSPWKIIHIKSASEARDIPRQLFVENDQLNQCTPASSFTLHLSPDTGNDTLSPSSIIEESANLLQVKDPSRVESPQFIKPADILQENVLNKVDSSKVVCPTSNRHSPLLEKDETHINLAVEVGKNENTYSELKKSIEGNLMGCEASLSDVELMDEIESSLNLEGEEDGGSYLAEPVVNINSKAEIFPDSVVPDATSSNEKQDVESSNKSSGSSNSSVKKTRGRELQEQMERRRSSRLAGIPTLPLKYTLEPLPDCRRVSSKKSSQKRSASPQRKENNPSPSSPKKHQSDSISVLPTLESLIEPPVTQVTWQEVCLLLPPCWANILEKHVKTHHPDEMLSIRDVPGGRCPTVYCNCSQNCSPNESR